MTPNQTAPDSPHTEPLTVYQLATIIISMFVSCVGLCGYSLYIYVVWKHKNTFSNPFYTLAQSLAIPDCMVSLVMLVYAYPTNLFRKDPYWEGIGWSCGLAMDFCWFLLISHKTAIAANRLLAVVCYTKVHVIFSKKRVRGILGVCYTFSLTMTALKYTCGCGQYFLGDTWTLDCDVRKALFSGWWPLNVDMYASNGVVVSVLLMNVLMVIMARRATKRILQDRSHGQGRIGTDNTSIMAARRAASERSMIIQCALVTLILSAYQASFWLMDFLKSTGEITAARASVTANLFASMTSAMNPLIYFVFGSEIRRKLRAVGKEQPLFKMVTMVNKTAILIAVKPAVPS